MQSMAPLSTALEKTISCLSNGIGNDWALSADINHFWRTEPEIKTFFKKERKNVNGNDY